MQRVGASLVLGDLPPPTGGITLNRVAVLPVLETASGEREVNQVGDPARRVKKGTLNEELGFK